MKTKSLNGNQLPDALLFIENAQIICPRKSMPIGVLKEQTAPTNKKPKYIY